MPANDTVETVTGSGGQSVQVTVHAPLPYDYKLISLPVMSDALRKHPGCMLVADYAAFLRGDPNFILYTPIPADQLAAYDMAPTFARERQYPFGHV